MPRRREPAASPPAAGRSLRVGDLLGAADATPLAELLRAALAKRGRSALVVDLQQADGAHLAAIQVLVAAAMYGAAIGRPLRLSGISPGMRALLDLVGMRAALTSGAAAGAAPPAR